MNYIDYFDGLTLVSCACVCTFVCVCVCVVRSLHIIHCRIIYVSTFNKILS